MSIFNHPDIIKYFSLSCHYQKGMIVYHEHDICDRLGLIIEGEVHMIHYTNQGEERILARLNPGDLFGDFLIHASLPYYPGNLVATKTSKIAYLDITALTYLMKTNDDFQHDYLRQLSEKALAFNQHNKILMQSTLREKILMWLNQQKHFYPQGKIPIQSKENLANYFNCQRPSLSRELANMKEEGLIDYNRYFIQESLS